MRTNAQRATLEERYFRRRLKRLEKPDAAFTIPLVYCAAYPHCQRKHRPLLELSAVTELSKNKPRKAYCSQTCFERYGK